MTDKKPVIGKLREACPVCKTQPLVRQAGRRGNHFYLECGCGINQSQKAPIQQHIWDTAEFYPEAVVKRPNNVKDTGSAPVNEPVEPIQAEQQTAPVTEAEPVEQADFDPDEPEQTETDEPAEPPATGFKWFLPVLVVAVAAGVGVCLS